MFHVRPIREVDLAVIITCHNYEQYLPTAIRSVLGQSLLPREIILVNDAPTTDLCRHIANTSPGIRYLETQHGNPFKARRAGFELTAAKHICFLDADDKLGRQYFEHAYEAMREDRRAAIISSDVQQFGLASRLQTWQPQLPAKRLQQTNFLHVGCVVDRDAIILSGAFDQDPPAECHEDWQFWRTIITAGYTYTKQRGLYLARIHSANRSTAVGQGGYFAVRGLANASIAFICLNPVKMHNIWPTTLASHHWVTPTPIPATIRAKLVKSHVDTSFAVCGGTGEAFLARAVNRIARCTLAEYICIMREPITETELQRLLRGLDHRVAITQLSNRAFPDGSLCVRAVLADHSYSHQPSLETSVRSKLDKHVELIKMV